MGNTWFCSDHHFGHANIVKFKDNEGNIIRSFENVEEHDEYIIEQHNKLVSPHDRVYFMGDVAIAKKNIQNVGRMNGKKVLLKGNHDIFKLNDYTPYFEDIRAYKMYPTHGIIVSHIPVHLSDHNNRFKWNLHGHTHINLVKTSLYNLEITDPKYINVCLEHTEMKPVSFDWVLKEIEKRRDKDDYIYTG